MFSEQKYFSKFTHLLHCRCMVLFHLFPNFISGTANITRELKKKLLKAMNERQKFNEIFLKNIHADGKKNTTLI